MGPLHHPTGKTTWQEHGPRSAYSDSPIAIRGTGGVSRSPTPSRRRADALTNSTVASGHPPSPFTHATMHHMYRDRYCSSSRSCTHLCDLHHRACSSLAHVVLPHISLRHKAAAETSRCTCLRMGQARTSVHLHRYIFIASPFVRFGLLAPYPSGARASPCLCVCYMCAAARHLPVEHTSVGRSLGAGTVDLAPRELAAAVATSGLSPVESGADSNQIHRLLRQPPPSESCRSGDPPRSTRESRSALSVA